MKLITFDFEGTLVDFQWNLAGAEGEAVAAMSEQGLSPELFSGMNYAALYNFVKKNEQQWGYADGSLTSIISQIYDKYDLDAASRWQPADGLQETLLKLKKYSLVLVSNIGRLGLAEVLPRFGLETSFLFSVNRNDVNYLKPDPEGLLKVIERTGVNRGDVIHVGDSLADLHAARAAGVKVCIILGGENKPEILIKENPDLVIEKLRDLPEALGSLHY